MTNHIDKIICVGKNYPEHIQEMKVPAPENPVIFLKPASVSPSFMDEEFSMAIDGVVRQRGYGNQMLMQPMDLLVYVSRFFPLCDGDLIFTGTPAGVSAIAPGAQVDLKWGRYCCGVSWS